MNRIRHPPRASDTAKVRGMHALDLNGASTYRSFHNNPAEVSKDAKKALGLIFAEANFTFSVDTPGKVTGTIDWGSGGLDLAVTIYTPPSDASPMFEIVGTGRPGTQTDGWEYDYNCRFAHQWPKVSIKCLHSWVR
jgi:hypothetical protein